MHYSIRVVLSYVDVNECCCYAHVTAVLLAIRVDPLQSLGIRAKVPKKVNVLSFQAPDLISSQFDSIGFQYYGHFRSRMKRIL